MRVWACGKSHCIVTLLSVFNVFAFGKMESVVALFIMICKNNLLYFTSSDVHVFDLFH